MTSPHPFFFHDGTERPRNRPSDPDAQRWYYRGKKNHHTVKNLLMIDTRSIMRCLGATYEGKWHDQALADDEPYSLPGQSRVYQDMGFQGFTVAGVIIVQPKKKPRGGDLTSEEKEQNQYINRIRVRIEHVIGSVKRYRIVKDKLRLWRAHIHDMLMETCCGLHNFRLRHRPWSYEIPNES